MFHQPSGNRIPVHVLQLFLPLLRALYVEVIEARLPESRRSGIREWKGHLRHGNAPPPPAHLPRHALLEHLKHSGGSALLRLPDPQLVTEFGQQALEPMQRARGFDPHADWLRQTAIKRVGLTALVVQPALDQLSGGFVHHGDLLIARVKITTYNEPAAAGSAPFPSLGRLTATKFTRRKEPTPSSNQPTKDSTYNPQARSNFSRTSSKNCTSIIDMKWFAEAWPYNGVVYHAFGPNSNTAARLVGLAGGFRAPRPPGSIGWNAKFL